MAGIEHITIAPGTPEHPRNDSATIVELRDGSLFMVWMEFLQSAWASADQAPNHLVSMKSRDGGRSWRERRVEAETEPGDASVYNPSLLRTAGGEILFFHIRYHRLVWGQPHEVSGWLYRSTDEARSWDAGLRLWEREPFCGANDTLFETSSGRIIKPVEHMPVWDVPPKGVSSSSCFLSDDGGRSWSEPSSWVRLPLRGSMEAHVAEARDRTLVMAVRNDLGSVFLSRSRDGGVSWSLPQTSGLSAPESMPVLKRIPTTGDLLLIWNHSDYDPGFVSHYGKRTPLTAAVSRDCGASWSRVRDIETDPTLQITNPSCTFLSTGKAIVTYFSSPMDEPNPPGRWGQNLKSLEGAIVDVDWFYG